MSSEANDREGIEEKILCFKQFFLDSEAKAQL